MPYQETGTIKAIGAEKQVNDSLTKRELLLETEGQYPQVLCFEAVKDKCRDLDTYLVGDRVTVHFNLRGRAYKDTAFNTLSLWKLER